jgi:hypothetical protein
MSNMNDYLNEMSKYLENSDGKSDKIDLNNINKDEFFEKFIMFQKSMQNQNPTTTTVIPKKTQNNITLSTSNNSENSKNKEDKEPEHHEDRIIEVQDKPMSFDDIPIQPKAQNFYELLESNLANAVEEVPQPKRVIKYEPRRRRTDIIQVSAPVEQKKYKYYSQNFNKNFGVEEQVPEVIVKKPEKKQDKRE